MVVLLPVCQPARHADAGVYVRTGTAHMISHLHVVFIYQVKLGRRDQERLYVPIT